MIDSNDRFNKLIPPDANNDTMDGVNQLNSELNQNKMGLKLLLYDKN